MQPQTDPTPCDGCNKDHQNDDGKHNCLKCGGAGFVTDPTARTFRSALVGWCRGCHVYVEPYIKGESCPMDCERDNWHDYNHRLRVLTKSRTLICSKCEMCFTTQEGAEEHECDSFYGC